METYDVTIRAVVMKTLKVDAESEEKAVELAHSLFTTVCESDVPESYDEELVDVKVASA